MKMKRITSAVTALLMCVGVTAAMPDGFSVGAQKIIITNDFDVTYEGWTNCGDYTVLEADETNPFNGSRSMHVTNRQTPDDGVSSEKGFYLEGGLKYDYSVYVYHNSKENEKFSLTLTYLSKDGKTYETETIDVEEAAPGEWVNLEGKFKAPVGASEFIVKLTTDSTADFYFDDFTVKGRESYTANTVSAAGSGLKDEFANYFKVGNILNGYTISNNTITASILKDYNSLECENETKPDATLVQSGSTNTNVKVSLSRCASILDFAAKNGISLRGHTLVWHSQTPEWFFKENFSQYGNWVSKNVMDQRLESYIKNMFEAYKTQYPTLDLYAYDVCNECISDDSNRTARYGGAREPGVGNGKSPWVQVYGDNSFIEKAFTYARQYAPSSCKLFYNDYNEYWDHKENCIYNTCKSLYSKGILDGVGMQSHINADANGFSGNSAYVGAMKKYLSIGCDVQVTELDISCENGKFSAYDQANKYKTVFQAAVDWNKNPQSTGRVTAVCIWGPNDANTWISGDNSPLLMDKNNQPKAAYNTLIGLLSKDEWGDGSNPVSSGSGSTYTPVELTADSNGYYVQCGFEGTADNWSGRGGCTVKSSSGKKYSGSSSLYVTDRSDTWHGAQYSMADYKQGETYSFSVDIMLDGASSETAYMKLQYNDADGEAHYDTIAEGTAVSGQWLQLANQKFTVPTGISDVYVYVETADSTTDFYIDDAVIAKSGTKVSGPDAPKAPKSASDAVIGDVDDDGAITVADLCLLKYIVLTGETYDAREKAAADVNQSRAVNAADAVMLYKYLMGTINKFEKAEPEVAYVDTSKMDSLFAGIKTASSYKKQGENNPLYTQRFGADPGWMVYDGRLYVYTTNDAFEYKNGQIQENSYDVRTLNCISSADLVNWTDHGAIAVAGNGAGTAPDGQQWASRWASRSWAPDAAWKTINGKDKFFLYFANNGSGVGVLTADSPTGPFKDPIGKELISRSTPNCNNVEWLFDPGVYYDEESGKGYLAFGGGVPGTSYSDPGTGRIVQLGDDMISIVGTPATLHPPYLFEDSSLIKIGNEWVYSFCHNWNTQGNPYGFGNADIGYMTSTNPLGQYDYKGICFQNTATQKLDNGGNNHHSIVEFKGEYYVLYHTRAVELRMGVNQNYRSPSISKATVSNGKISCKGDMKGVSQLETLNPYETQRAATMSDQAGINVKGVGDTVVTQIDKGDWIKVSGVNFSKGASSVTVKASSSKGGVIKICTGSPTGEAIGYVEVPAGSMSEITAPVNDINGTKDLYFVFSDSLEFDSWVFN